MPLYILKKTWWWDPTAKEKIHCTWVLEHGDISSSVLTLEPHLIDQHWQCWETLCMVQERKSHHQAYSAMNSVSYSHDPTDTRAAQTSGNKTHFLVGFHSCSIAATVVQSTSCERWDTGPRGELTTILHPSFSLPTRFISSNHTTSSNLHDLK